MSSNLDYLDPQLLPLEDKVNAYLAAEKELQRTEVEALNLPRTDAQAADSAASFEQRPPTGNYDQHAEEVQQKLQNLRDDLALLREEIVALLPTRDAWVKVNLGYGPSRVGAFRLDGEPADNPRYELRIVH